MSASSPAPASPISAMTSTCVDKDAGKIAALQARRDADLRAGPRRAGRRATCGPGGCRFTTDLAGAGGRGRRGLHRGRHAVAARRRPCRPVLRLRRGRARSPARSTASPSSSPSRPCRSAPATRSSASSARRGPDAEFAVVSNPEFLREGAAIEDFKRPDRIVIGTEDERARDGDGARSTGRSTSTSAPILFTDRRTAELIKYAANAFLATKITFINEIADLCEEVGADVQEVARGIGLDNRIGAQVPACRARATAAPAFRRTRWRWSRPAQDYGAPLRIVETVVAVNDAAQARHGAQGDRGAAAASVRGKTVAVLGLTFKPNTDDMREAPSIPMITALQDWARRSAPTIRRAWSRPRRCCRMLTYCDDAL